jgi:hypothetical protein
MIFKHKGTKFTKLDIDSLFHQFSTSNFVNFVPLCLKRKTYFQ